MKVILETADLIRILGAHFGAEFDAENVTIKTDPFEVEVRGIPLPESERTTLPAARARLSTGPVSDVARTVVDTDELIAARADADASGTPPPPGADSTDTSSVSGTPMALLAQSRQLEAELDRDRPRQRRGGSAKPPSDFHDEVR